MFQVTGPATKKDHGQTSNAGGMVQRADRLQMLITGDVSNRRAAFDHVLWYTGLQIPTDYRTEFVLHLT